jgi:transposase-like protein
VRGRPRTIQAEEARAAYQDYLSSGDSIELVAARNGWKPATLKGAFHREGLPPRSPVAGPRISAEKVRAIRAYDAKGLGSTEIARRTGVSQSAVWKLLHWKTPVFSVRPP